MQTKRYVFQKYLKQKKFFTTQYSKNFFYTPFDIQTTPFDIQKIYFRIYSQIIYNSMKRHKLNNSFNDSTFQ